MIFMKSFDLSKSVLGETITADMSLTFSDHCFLGSNSVLIGSNI